MFLVIILQAGFQNVSLRDMKRKVDKNQSIQQRKETMKIILSLTNMHSTDILCDVKVIVCMAMYLTLISL